MKILIISSNLIGDTLLSTGVIKNLSIKYPNARFTIVIGPTARSIFKNFKSVEKIITIKKKKYNMHWINILFRCFGNKWDIIVDFRSSLLCYFLPHKTKYIFKKNNISNQIQQLSDFFRFDCSDLFIDTSKKEEEIVEKNISKNCDYFVIFPGGIVFESTTRTFIIAATDFTCSGVSYTTPCGGATMPANVGFVA